MVPMALRIRRARTRAGLSQGGLAHHVGVHRSAVTQWEREGGTCPSVEHLSSISVATRVPFEWLATGRGEVTDCPEFTVPTIATDYAMDEMEARLLELVRRLPHRKRGTVCTLIESLLG